MANDSIKSKFDRLTEIEKQLNNENISIDDSLKLYNEAIQLGKDCLSYIEEGQKRLESLNTEQEKLSNLLNNISDGNRTNN